MTKTCAESLSCVTYLCWQKKRQQTKKDCKELHNNGCDNFQVKLPLPKIEVGLVIYMEKTIAIIIFATESCFLEIQHTY